MLMAMRNRYSTPIQDLWDALPDQYAMRSDPAYRAAGLVHHGVFDEVRNPIWEDETPPPQRATEEAWPINERTYEDDLPLVVTDGNPLNIARGLRGAVQEIFRAELRALVHAVEVLPCGALIAFDNKAVVDMAHTSPVG